MITTDLGAVTAYAEAVIGGYTGTKEEFEYLMANFANGANEVRINAGIASAAAEEAMTAADEVAANAEIAKTSAESAKASEESCTENAEIVKTAADAEKARVLAENGRVEAEKERRAGYQNFDSRISDLESWGNYSEISSMADDDMILVKDVSESTTKKTKLSGLSNWFFGKLANAAVSGLGTKNKTVVGAINELNTLSPKVSTLQSALATLTTNYNNYTSAAAFKKRLLDYDHPVGSVVVRYDSINPGTLYGGTWKALEQNAYLRVGATWDVGKTGGSTEVSWDSTGLMLAKPEGGNTYGLDSKDESFTGRVPVTSGSIKYGNNLPPYIYVVVWRRTA